MTLGADNDANRVANSSLVSGFLWSNAGFGKLKNVKELEGVEPRYDPTVIVSHAATASTHDSIDQSAFLDEDFTGKAPKSIVFPSALDYHEAYKSGQLTPTAVAEALLPLIRRDVASPSKYATAFMGTKVDLVCRAAAASTQRYRDGKPRSPLDGVLVAVKDEVDLTGYTKTYGSGVDFTHSQDATSYCVQKWIDAGAIVVGKTSMHELGLDTTNLNPIHGTPLNPYAPSYYPGGSSGGSGSVVGSGLVPIALGADGGGSIRIPSAYCGIYGLKPSHNRISIAPTTSIAASTGVVGPMTANMLDLELAYRIMAAPDPSHPTQSSFPSPNPAPTTPKHKILGICTPWISRSDPAIQTLFLTTLTHLTQTLSYTLVEIPLPFLPEGQMAHAMTILAEIATLKTPLHKLSAPNKILLSTGKNTPAPDLLQAQKLRHLIMQHLSHLYEQHPGLIILTPTTPNAGWPIHPGDQAYGASHANMSVRAMEYVWLANFSGCPALNAPMGYVKAEQGEGRVPAGIMGMGEWGSEEELVGFGYDLERYLQDGYEGGRPRPEAFVDVMDMAKTAIRAA